VSYRKRALTGTLCIVGQHIWLGVTALRRVRGDGADYRDSLTEKTIRKNGLKWSNISVKKYHQSPGLGVRSGSRNLMKKSSACANAKGKRESYPAPQEFRTHPQPPVTRVDANTKATKKKPNSTTKGMHLRSFCGNGLGEAKCD